MDMVHWTTSVINSLASVTVERALMVELATSVNLVSGTTQAVNGAAVMPFLNYATPRQATV